MAQRSDPFAAEEGQISQKVVQGLVKLGLAMRHRAWRYTYPHALTPTQAQILTYLLSREPQVVLVSEVAQALAVTLPTASDAIEALVRKGLVHKRISLQDRRSRALSLTPAGRRLARRLRLWPDVLLEAVEDLGPEERSVLLRALMKMIQVLQERGEIPLARMCFTCVYFRPNVHPDPLRPHHCAFVDAPFGDLHLRLDCRDHRPAEAVSHP